MARPASEIRLSPARAEQKAWRESIKLAVRERNSEIIEANSYPAWWSMYDETLRLQAVKEILYLQGLGS